MNRFVRKNIVELSAYDVKKLNYIAKLDANESFIPIDNMIVNLFLKGIDGIDFNRYPDHKSQSLIGAYSDYAAVPPENIIAGNGSDELIDLIVKTFVDNGDNVLTLNPDFVMYEQYTMIMGGNIIKYETGDDFNFDIDTFIKAVKENNVKLIFISNPNNPTGALRKREDLIKILEESGSIVVIDEAYYEFSGETLIDLVDSYENLIILRTLSKAFSLAALRIGFLISSRDIINEILKVKSPYNLNSLSQYFGEIALKNSKLILKNVKDIITERDYLFEELNKIEGIKTFPSRANFILFKSLVDIDLNTFYDGKILVKGFTKGRLKGFIRVTAGCRKENDLFINKLKALTVINK